MQSQNNISNNNNMVEIKVASPLEQLLLDVKILQQDISADLTVKYNKAFDLKYRPGFFKSARFKDYKKKMAENLAVLCKMELKSLSQVAYFISLYQEYRQINEINDPEGFFDGLRNKPKGGTLGGVFSAHALKVHNINVKMNDLIYAFNIHNNLKLEIYQNLLAKAEEVDEFDNSFGTRFDVFNENKKDEENLPFHDIKILKIKNDQKTKIDLLEEISTLDKIKIHSKTDQISEQKKDLQQKIQVQQMERMKLNILNLRENSYFHALDFGQKIKRVIQQEIIRRFVDSLLYEEKKFFWRWCLRSTYGNLKTENKGHQSFFKGVNVIEKSKEFYMNETNCGYSSLLKNDKLKGLLDVVSNENNLDSNAIDDVVKMHLSSNLSGLTNLIKSDKLWNLLVTYPDCEWISVLEKLVTDKLKSPLEILENMLDDSCLQNLPSYKSRSKEEEYLLGIIQQVSSLLNGISEMEEKIINVSGNTNNNNNQYKKSY